MDYRSAAGASIFIGAVQFVMGMLLAEFLYPGYSASDNYISDLGATCRDTCIIQQPSASIFNASVVLLGMLLLIGSYFLWNEFHNFLFTVLFALAGAGAVGVGVFPETAGVVHELASLAAFLFGGLSAIFAFKLVKAPFTYFSLLLGITSLTALVLFISEIYLGLGPGGMERMIAYPVLLWATGFGGNLMSSQKSLSDRKLFLL